VGRFLNKSLGAESLLLNVARFREQIANIKNRLMKAGQIEYSKVEALELLWDKTLNQLQKRAVELEDDRMKAMLVKIGSVPKDVQKAAIVHYALKCR
jgi:hypothetical protein